MQAFCVEGARHHRAPFVGRRTMQPLAVPVMVLVLIALAVGFVLGAFWGARHYERRRRRRKSGIVHVR